MNISTNFYKLLLKKHHSNEDKEKRGIASEQSPLIPYKHPFLMLRNRCVNLFKQGCGKISISAVGKQHNDRFTDIFCASRNLRCRVKCRARRDSNNDSLGTSDSSRRIICLICSNFDHLIVYIRVKHLGNKSGANTLQAVTARLPP